LTPALVRFDRLQAGFVAELDGRAVPCLAWVLQSGSGLAADVATDDIQDNPSLREFCTALAMLALM
jgi:hypothetical protein